MARPMVVARVATMRQWMFPWNVDACQRHDVDCSSHAHPSESIDVVQSAIAIDPFLATFYRATTNLAALLPYCSA
jgi:hypothetical protein